MRDEWTISLATVDPSALLGDWRWLLREPHEMILLTAMGDAFLADGGGAVHFLDTLEGRLRPIAATREGFAQLVRSGGLDPTWINPDMIALQREQGRTLAAGECYHYKLPPVLGGSLESANVEPIDALVHFTAAGQLHRQLAALPPGERIAGFQWTERRSATEPVVLANPVTGMTLRIVRSAEETGGELLEMEAGYPAGSAPPPSHWHPRQEERFVLLEGRMRAVVGGVERDLVAGESLVIPAGVAHAMWNPGPESARVIWQVRPALRTQQFFATVFALAARGQVNADGVPGLLDLALLMPYFRPEIQAHRPPAWVQSLVFGVLAPLARLVGRCPELRRKDRS